MGKGSVPTPPPIQTPPAYDPNKDASLMAMSSMMTSEAPALPALPSMLERTPDIDWKARRQSLKDKIMLKETPNNGRTYGNSVLTGREKFDDEERTGLLRN